MFAIPDLFSLSQLSFSMWSPTSLFLLVAKWVLSCNGDFDPFSVSWSKLITYPADDVGSLSVQFAEVLSELLDMHAPKVTKNVTLRHFAPWYNDEIRAAKRERRRCERQYVKSGLQVHKKIFRDQYRKCQKLLNTAKLNFHRSELAECDPRQLFRTVDKLCSPITTQVLPSRDDDELANDFDRFFVEKIEIEKVKDKFDDLSTHQSQYSLMTPPTAVFSSFAELTEESIRKIVMKSPSSSSALDCIPTYVVTEELHQRAPTFYYAHCEFISAGWNLSYIVQSC